MSVAASETTHWLGKLSAVKFDAAKKRDDRRRTAQAFASAHHLRSGRGGRARGWIAAPHGALAFRFGTYWRVVADRRRAKPDLRLPFYRIKSDGFWRPLEANGRPAESRERAVMAQFNIAFLVCLQDPELRMLTRRTLIAKYFEPTERAELYALCGLPVPPDDL